MKFLTHKRKIATVSVCSLLTGLFVFTSPASPSISEVAAAEIALPVCGASNTPSVNALANPTFYIDSGISPKLDATYAGYTIRAGSSSETNLRIELSGFTQASIVKLATGQSESVTIPTMSPGTTHTSYFLLHASSPTTEPQTHDIVVYRGPTPLCQRTFTYTRVAETIKALANKVDSVTQTGGGENITIGETVVVTVLGRTGTLGAGPTYDPGVLSYAPNAMNGFPVNAWRLEKTELTIKPTGTEDTTTTFVDRLYLSGASGPDRPYTAKYHFRAVGHSNTVAVVRPVQYIASGTQVKHTDLAGSVIGVLPEPETAADLLITKTASITNTPSLSSVELTVDQTEKITVTYTVRIINSGGSTGTLDLLEDTLASSTTFVTGSARLANRNITPTIDGRTLSVFGPITIAAGATVVFEYLVEIPPVAGSYSNSVVGFYGNTQIDNSTDVRSSDPATASVTLFAPAGAIATQPEAVITNPGTSIVIDVLANDDLGVSSSVKYNPEVTQLSVSTNPATGTATVITDPGSVDKNKIIYTPAGSFGGKETFQYTVTSGPSSGTATVTIQVPKANYDEYLTAANSLTIATADGLLTNDLCPVNNPLGSSADDLITGCKVQANSLMMATGVAGAITQNADNNGGFTFTAPNQTHPKEGYRFVYVLVKTIGGQTWTASGSGRIYINNAGPDRTITTYRSAVDINVTSNDSGCSPSPCRMPSNNWDTTAPLNGQITRVNENVIRYTPDAGFAGVNTFQYNLQGGSQGTEVTVLVAPPNGSYTTPFNTTINKDINSTFVDDFYGTGKPSPTNAAFTCPTCEFSISQAPSKGTASVANIGTSASRTGRFTYTPSPTAVGSDTFKIGITHETGLFVEHQISINIGPKAVGDSVTTLVGTPRTFNVLTNDDCPTTCTLTLLTSPASGTLENNGSGSFTYTNNSDIGEFSFTYQIESSVSPGVTATASVRIQVDGAVDDAVETSPGIPININVRANDLCLSCTVAQVNKPTVGTASLNTNGTVTYSPPSTFAGIATFTYDITKDSQFSTATVTVTVRPDARDDQDATQVAQTLDLDVLRNDICADCTITNVTTPSGSGAGATASISGDGYSIAYRAPDTGTTDSFTYTITDSTGATDTATVTITIAVPPAAVDDTAITVTGTAVAINVAANDTCTTVPCAYQVNTDPSDGSVSLSVAPGKQFAYVPRAGFTGTDSFTYTIITSTGLTATSTVHIKIAPLANDNFYVVGTNQTITIEAGSNDVCLTCDWILRNSPGTGKGSLGTFNSSGVISYTAPATPGTYSFTYKVRERTFGPQDVEISLFSTQETQTENSPEENEAFATVTILVGDASPDNFATNYNTVSDDVNVISNDTCESASCVIASDNDISAVSPPGAGVATRVNETDVSFTPTSGFSGIATFTYTATYGPDGANTATATVTVLVGPATILRVTDKNTQIGRVEVDDTEPIASLSSPVTCAIERCTYSLKTAPTYGEIVINEDGTYGYKPEPDFTGSETDIVYTITDTETGLHRDGILRITVSSEASLLLQKTGQLNLGGNGRADSGDLVTYTYVVGNDGDTTVTNIVVTDNKIQDDQVNIICPGRTNDADKNIIPSIAPRTGSADPIPTVTCTATYVLTQQDVDAGIVTNLATATGSADISGDTTVQITTTATANVNIARSASTTLEKFAGPIMDRDESNNDTVGDTITYTYRVTNTGNVTLTNVTIVDDKIADDATNVECVGFTNGIKNRVPSLAPNNSATCTAVYALTDADIAAKQVTNTATATATPPAGASPPTPSSSSVTVLVDQKATLSLAKSVTEKSWTSPALPSVGSTITYSYAVTNTGDVDLTNITVVDDKIANDATNIVCPGRESSSTKNVIPSLAENSVATVICTATYALTQADIDAGSVTNVAIASTNYTVNISGTQTTSTITAIDEETVSGLSTVEYTIAKSGTPNLGSNGRVDAGETISYTYTVTNTGTATLISVTVDDDKFANDATEISCQGKESSPKNVIANLAPAATATCTATYTVTQSDLDSGYVTNIATGTSSPGTSPSTRTATATVVFTQASTLSLVKTAGTITDNSPSGISAGDTIPYTYTVTNAGNVTLSNITVTDDKIADDATNIACANRGGETVKNLIATLEPGAVSVCSATYTVSSSDYTAASVTNIGTASTTFDAYNPSLPNTPTTRSVQDTGTVTVSLANPKLSLTLTGLLALNSVAPNDRADAGDLITYTYRVQNTGNVALQNIDVSDIRTSTGAIDCDGVTEGSQNTIAILNVDAELECTATYPITQSDIDLGTVSNTATASTKYPDTDGVTVADNATTAVPITPSPALAVSKTAIINSGANNRADAGETISYTITVTNTGNTTLTSIVVTDAKLANLDCDATTPEAETTVASLAPTATATCTGTYTLIQSDIDTGSVSNTAAASTGSTTNETTVNTPISQSPSLSVTKSAVTSFGSEAPTTSDSITYTITVTNTGNTTLTSIVVTDAKLANLDCDATTPEAETTVASLAPTATATCTGTYTLIQSDIDTGSVSNTAAASTTFNGSAVTANDTEVTYLVLTSLSVTKTVTGTSFGTDYPEAGDTITYNIAVTNNGQVKLFTIEVDDPLLDGLFDCNSGVPGNQDTIDSIEIGATATCTGTYTLTQSDIDTGKIENTATAQSGTASNTSNKVTTTLARTASLTLTKTGTLDNTVVEPNDTTQIGDVIFYTYTITNTGNVTLTNVTLVDDKITDDSTIICPANSGTANVIATLLPGNSNAIECEVVYSITSSDVLGTTVTNLATVTGSAPTDVSNPITTATETVDINPSVNLNAEPVEASDDEISGPMGAILEIEVLANDIGDNLQIILVDQPQSGETQITDDLVIYTPDLTFTGTEKFTYTVTNGANTSTGNVTVTVANNLLQPIPEIFLDTNGNGVRDGQEPGIGGIQMETRLLERGTVRVRPGAASVTKPMGLPTSELRTFSSARVTTFSVMTPVMPGFTCATGAGGSCDFGNVPMGSYKIEARFNPADHGMKRTTTSEDPASLVGTSKPSGGAMTKVAFGVTGRCTLKGRAHDDVNNNGRYYAGIDKPLISSDLQVIWNGVDTRLGTSDDVLIIARTTKDGRYQIKNLPLGRYRIIGTEKTIVCKLTPSQMNDSSFTKIVSTDVNVKKLSVLPQTGTTSNSSISKALALLISGTFLVLLTRSRRRRSL